MVADLRQERLDDIQRLYPEIVATRRFDEMLDQKVDAVVVATPVNTHYALAKQALLAGKHVFVEKPITAQTAQARELVDIAAQKILILMVGHMFMYNPAVEAVRDIVQSGQLGNIYYFNGNVCEPGAASPILM